MKAAVASGYGMAADVVSIVNDWPRPSLDGKKKLLVRVHACSVSPGDKHCMSGGIRALIAPSSFPYVVGMDVCGVVEAADDGTGFSVGDMVWSSNGVEPWGGMAEVTAVKASETALKPKGVDVLTAASSTSALTAVNALEAGGVQTGSRVLVLGGSGGVGTATVQLCKNAGASFVATTSTQGDLMTSLGADRVVDYRSENWWEINEFRETRFDAIIDCVGGNNHWIRAADVLKSRADSGTFVAVCDDNPNPEYTSICLAIGPLFKSLLGRPLWNLLTRKPYYKLVMTDSSAAAKTKVLSLLDSGRLNIILDSSSPLPFTEEGVKAAFAQVESRHAHGKVTVKM